MILSIHVTNFLKKLWDGSSHWKSLTLKYIDIYILKEEEFLVKFSRSVLFSTCILKQSSVIIVVIFEKDKKKKICEGFFFYLYRKR